MMSELTLNNTPRSEQGSTPQTMVHHANHDPIQLKVTGSLKFFYENDLYGFLVGDQDGKDVFFHFDDMKLLETLITKEHLSHAARDPHVTMRFAFNKLAYFGRYGLSMKAINLEYLGTFMTNPHHRVSS
jgi:'Cold-shock' DNA-binding domain